MVKIAFITGITGQDGSYLAELLLEKNYIVWGMIRRSSNINTNKIEHIFHQLILRYGDITDSLNIMNILNEIKNKYDDMEILEIYNLAAQSHVKISFELPEYTCQVDALGTLKLLECIKNLNMNNKIKFYQASTSELFGDVLEVPQKETTPFNPRSPYAIAKLYSYWIVKLYREAYGMFLCNGILMNHESCRRGHNFVTRKITIGLNKILNDKNFILNLGNLNSLRDWGHSKDFCKGMWLMLQQDKPDDFLLATGVQYSIRDFIEKAFSLRSIQIKWDGTGLDECGYDVNTNRKIICINKKYFRPSEVNNLIGDASKAKNILKWHTTITFDELIKEMVDHDCSVSA